MILELGFLLRGLEQFEGNGDVMLQDLLEDPFTLNGSRMLESRGEAELAPLGGLDVNRCWEMRLFYEWDQDCWFAASLPHNADWMRPEEVFQLQAEDLVLSQRYLKVVKGKTRLSRRNILLTIAALEVLSAGSPGPRDHTFIRTGVTFVVRSTTSTAASQRCPRCGDHAGLPALRLPTQVRLAVRDGRCGLGDTEGTHGTHVHHHHVALCAPHSGAQAPGDGEA